MTGQDPSERDAGWLPGTGAALRTPGGPGGSTQDGALDADAVGGAPGPGAAVGGAPGREGTVGGVPRAAALRDARRARLAYLAAAVPVAGFAVPLLLYVLAVRRSRWLRAHTAQALNTALTVTLYGISAVIAAVMLALGSPLAALVIMVPAVALLWLASAVFLLRAAAAASRGENYAVPRWLRATLAR